MFTKPFIMVVAVLIFMILSAKIAYKVLNTVCLTLGITKAENIPFLDAVLFAFSYEVF